ncbi:MAG: hypothetical protein Q9178_000820 [Gyalolechia marmorata]
MDLAYQQEMTVLRELYPDPEPGVPRIAATELMQMIEVAGVDMSCTDEDRLRSLHRMLELCTIEHEFEVQNYQASHRRLVEQEGKYNEMLLTPDVPSCAFTPWESYIDRNMSVERANMKESRKKTRAILKAIRFAEEQVGRIGKVVVAQGKANRHLESDQHELIPAEQIKTEPQTQFSMRKYSITDRNG